MSGENDNMAFWDLFKTPPSTTVCFFHCRCDIIKRVSENLSEVFSEIWERKKEGILKGYNTKLQEVGFDLNNFQKILTNHQNIIIMFYVKLCAIRILQLPIFVKQLVAGMCSEGTISAL